MDTIAAFDTLYTNNHVQICKLLLPLLPKDKQHYGAIFIKYLELQYTIQHGKDLHPQPDIYGSKKTDYQKLCQEMLPYCTDEEENLVKKILEILKLFDTFQSIKPLMDMMSQFGSSMNGESENPSGFDFSSLFTMGDLFSASDISSIMELFQGNINPDILNTVKDAMPDGAKDFFVQENNTNDDIIENENRSEQNE